MKSRGFDFFEAWVLRWGDLIAYLRAGFGPRPLLLYANAQLPQNRGFPESTYGVAHPFHPEM